MDVLGHQMAQDELSLFLWLTSPQKPIKEIPVYTDLFSEHKSYILYVYSV